MKIFSKFITTLFIDNPYLCCYGCHRNPKRSFFLNNRQFNVCARCTGIISGILISIPLIFLNFIYINYYLLFFTLLNFFDGTTQLLKWRESNNKLRFLLGLGFGFSLLFFIKGLIK